jgi:hypothetical protein
MARHLEGNTIKRDDYFRVSFDSRRISTGVLFIPRFNTASVSNKSKKSGRPKSCGWFFFLFFPFDDGNTWKREQKAGSIGTTRTRKKRKKEKTKNKLKIIGKGRATDSRRQLVILL